MMEPTKSTPDGIKEDTAKFSSNRESKLLDQLLQESKVMTEHALGSGLRVPPSTVETVEESDIKLSSNHKLEGSERTYLVKQLSRVHGQLAEIVAPAVPRSLKFLKDCKEVKAEPWYRRFFSFKWLGPVPLVRWMIAAAIVSLVGFIFLTVVREIYVESKVMADVLESISLLFAAGMGASYLALYQANRYIVEGTFDPKYNSSYWIRFVLGLIAGVILAELIAEASGGALDQFGKPILALLGGFSASVVYRILTRLVEAVESIFRGDEREIITAQEQAAKAKLAEQNAQDRLVTAAELRTLSQQITPEGINEAKQKMNKIIDDTLVPFGFETSEEV